MYGYEDSEEEPGLCINYLLHLYARIKYFLPDFRQMQNVPYSWCGESSALSRQYGGREHGFDKW